jgi:hypothetical protein
MLNIFSALRRSTPMAWQAPKPEPSIPAPAKTTRCFISYRRGDSAGITGRIFDRLSLKYGAGSVFMDIDAIPIGMDFVNVLANEIRQCDVIFAVIGPRWLGPKGSSGIPRIHDSNDFIRMELEAAIQLGKPVIPILVDGAVMPRPEDVPASLAPILYRNAVAVDSGPDFHSNMDRLITAVDGLLDRTAPQPSTPFKGLPDINTGDLEADQVFVSHATVDRDWVEKVIIPTLNEGHVKTWYSKASISSAAQWEREILKGLEASDWFLIVISKAASKSEWVKDELFWAMTHRPTRIVPVIHEHCDLWSFHIRLPRLQYIDFSTRGAARGELLKAFANSVSIAR